jgi:hypothetical protein|tara:strand:+ start:106 stop:303 length:198 start_codon:yes stop_codon:yes gene_type:complete
MAIQRITKIGTKPTAGARIKIVSGPKKDEDYVKLSAGTVYDPADGEDSRAVNTTTGYFGTRVTDL